MILITLAVLMLAFIPEIQGKSQNAEIKNEIEGGHHNTIVASVDQVAQIANKNNVPYGQLKKIADDGSGPANGNSGFDLSQNMDIQNKIAGGHHNTIAVNGRQAAALGAMGPANNSTTTINLSQTLNTQNQITGGHHNLIMLSSSQVALISELYPGNLSQAANIYNQITGGHHNVIVVGSNQLAWLNITENQTY
jgi:hypothetical protein